MAELKDKVAVSGPALGPTLASTAGEGCNFEIPRGVVKALRELESKDGKIFGYVVMVAYFGGQLEVQVTKQQFGTIVPGVVCCVSGSVGPGFGGRVQFNADKFLIGG